MRSPTRTLSVVAAALVVGVTLAACGGDGGGKGSGANAPVEAGARVIPVEARSFAFSPDTVKVRAGEAVALELTSTDAFHNIDVEGTGVVVGVSGGKTAKGGLTIDKAGTYQFWCNVPGHRAAGMEGTIVVR